MEDSASVYNEEKYTQEEKLGNGAHGVVYKAISNLTEKLSVMKVIQRDQLKESKNYAVLQNELEFIQELVHKNIMRLEEFFFTDNETQLILQYCNQGTIIDYMKLTKKIYFTEEEAWVNLKGVVSGYKQIYKHKGQHRGIKPENLFMNDGQILIGDFALSNHLLSASQFEKSKPQTSVNNLIYQAPEIIENKEYTNKADQWAVGASFFYMLFGRPPFKGLEKWELLKEHKERSGSRLEMDSGIKISTRCKDLLQRMLTYNEDERITWEELINHPLLKDQLFGSFLKIDTKKFNANAYKNGEYIGTLIEGKRSGPGKFKNRNGDVYDGEWLDNVPHGKGFVKCKNGVKYDGGWKYGKPDGFGELDFSNGKKFVGEFKEGVITAKGFSTVREIKIIDEDQQDDQRLYGEKTVINQEKFNGQFSNGSRNGFGITNFTDGRKYEGNWVDGKYDGQGEYTWGNGEKYVGKFQCGLRSGKGIVIYNKGGRYNGQWKDDKKEGYGEYTFANGDKYAGNWVSGSRNGKGIMSCIDGRKYDVEWKDDKKHGWGEFTFSGGDKYVGEWKNGFRSGKGVQNYQIGSKFDGEWEDDKRHGYGEYTLVNGDRYEGQWLNDFKHGIGVCFGANGYRKRGYWEDGSLVKWLE